MLFQQRTYQPPDVPQTTMLNPETIRILAQIRELTFVIFSRSRFLNKLEWPGDQSKECYEPIIGVYAIYSAKKEARLPLNDVLGILQHHAFGIPLIRTGPRLFGKPTDWK